MNKEKLKILLLSQVEDDRLLAIEYLTKMSRKEILDIFLDKALGYKWRKPDSQQILYTSSSLCKEGKTWKCKRGYIAYNGFTWYVENKKELIARGYKIEENE